MPTVNVSTFFKSENANFDCLNFLTCKISYFDLANFIQISNGQMLLCSSTFYYHWDRGNNSYFVLGTCHGFSMGEKPDEQDDDLWDYWGRNDELFGLNVEYYQKNPDPDIHVYEKEGAADSESSDGE